MSSEPGILTGKGKTPQSLLLKYANRHGLIAGATGKTIFIAGFGRGIFESRRAGQKRIDLTRNININ
jgi:hypothetical protein